MYSNFQPKPSQVALKIKSKHKINKIKRSLKCKIAIKRTKFKKTEVY